IRFPIASLIDSVALETNCLVWSGNMGLASNPIAITLAPLLKAYAAPIVRKVRFLVGKNASSKISRDSFVRPLLMVRPKPEISNRVGTKERYLQILLHDSH